MITRTRRKAIPHRDVRTNAPTLTMRALTRPRSQSRLPPVPLQVTCLLGIACRLRRSYTPMQHHRLIHLPPYNLLRLLALRFPPVHPFPLFRRCPRHQDHDLRRGHGARSPCRIPEKLSVSSHTRMPRAIVSAPVHLFSPTHCRTVYSGVRARIAALVRARATTTGLTAPRSS